MIKPQIENIPDFIGLPGKKIRTQECYADLLVLKSKLLNINFDSQARAVALNRVGIIECYMNNYVSGLSTFRDSFETYFSEAAYKNYLQTLEALERLPEVFTNGLDFLDDNPNNILVYKFLLRLSKKYSLIDEFNHLKRFSSYHVENAEFIEYIKSTEASITENNEYLISKGIDLNYYQSSLTAAASIVRFFYNGDFQVRTTEDEFGVISVRYCADLTKNELRFVNKEFDRRIDHMINSGKLDFDIYLDQMKKIIFGFEIFKNKTVSEVE